MKRKRPPRDPWQPRRRTVLMTEEEVAARQMLASASEEAMRRARDHLLALQSSEGWWKGELQTNVTMDAEDMLLREFLGIREPRRTGLSANWIRSQQHDDGSWTNFEGGTANLSTTVEAYVALRLAGPAAVVPRPPILGLPFQPRCPI